ncbi:MULTISPECIES: hypothetical protein [Mycobacteriaceae]|nr:MULTISPECIES: hypothetical protein [Mycobacteriaceae]AMO06993.1 hypothetical protein MyAD_19510 [Mycolicibacterium neoaurum]AXK74633.1 hypothetical protein DXK33_05425 [Mycolicibacterium neoaurum]KJQ48342.1 hypothetical protein TS71_21825 [Mycolicibacterium neoaurum]KUM06622.1 hypothetical protein AVZ31_20590 [Mycolicibacterium neoaurum]
MALRIAGFTFSLMALVAGGLQLWAYAESDWPRHLILGVFACAVGVSVLAASSRKRNVPPSEPEDGTFDKRDRYRGDQ